MKKLSIWFVALFSVSVLTTNTAWAGAAKLTSIKATPANSTIQIGITQQFYATGTYSDGSTKDLTNSVTWNSTTTSVATISNTRGSKGLATSVAAGSTTISASSGNFSGSTTLTVALPVTLASISVTPVNQNAISGSTVQFTATGIYSDGSSKDISTSAVWSSSNTSVATINSNGSSTAVYAGSTTITATYGGVSGSTTLTVAAINVSVNLPKTGQVTSYAAGDDGNLQKGASWPIPRFVSYSTAMRSDRLTGLGWTPGGNVPPVGTCTGGIKTWQEALDYVACLNTFYYMGYNDWRLPNRKELRSLVNYEQVNPATWLNTQGFSNVQSNFTGNYWSSSTIASSPVYGWCVQMQNGELNYNYCAKTSGAYVLPVRSGEISAAVDLPVTGQTTSYAAGDDGDLQKGVSWPATRFSANADTTITDNLTGLIWTSDANIPGPLQCFPAYPKKWYEAIDYVACLNTSNYLGYADWRLPNVNELESLINAGQTNSAAWLNTQGFANVQSYDYYWTSTTYAPDTIDPSAVKVSLRDGDISHGKKDCGCSYFYVWPVRGGQ